MDSENEGAGRPGPPGGGSKDALESMLIEQYLHDRGFTADILSSLDAEEARKLLAKASAHASGRLAEMETRARLKQEIHRRPKKVE